MASHSVREQRNNQNRYSIATNRHYMLYENGEYDEDEDVDECICHFPLLDFFRSRNKSRRPSKASLFGSPIPDTPDFSNRKYRRNFLESMEQERGSVGVMGISQGGISPSTPPTGVWSGRGVERDLHSKYKLLNVLGVGSTSTCHRCLERATDNHFACKIIDKRHMEMRFAGMLEQFHVEIEALRSLQHPNIIHLNDVYITQNKIYIVMELMDGGELFDYVVKRGTLTELEASNLMRQITSAIEYMHSQGIVHRDLKPENLLLKTKAKPGIIPTVKIIDFGLSKNMQDTNGAFQQTTRSFLGTRGYLAPEMLQRRAYDKSVDSWALGVIAFVLLCGCLPFDDDSGSLPTDTAIRERFSLRFPRWASNLSADAKDLLKHLLDINPATRFTATQALNHRWIQTPNTEHLRSSILQSPRHIKLASSAPGITSHMGTPAKVEANQINSNDLAKIRGKANQITGIDDRDHMHLTREASI